MERKGTTKKCLQCYKRETSVIEMNVVRVDLLSEQI